MTLGIKLINNKEFYLFFVDKNILKGLKIIPVVSRCWLLESEEL